MAQAPQGPTGAPRQNKTVKEFRGMNTQNRRNAIPEGSFAWLENIQPIGPAHLHSIPGRSTSVIRIPPLIPPVLCTDATFRGQQPITIEQRFDQQPTFPGVLHTSWGYITAAEEIFTLIGDSGCAGGNMAYDATCCQINHYQTPLIVTHPALINPDILLPATNTVIGTSDEPIYGLRPASNQFKCYYPNSLTSVLYTLPAGYVALTGEGENIFCKKGTSIYFTCHYTVTPFDQAIVEYNAASGILLNTFLSLPQFNSKQIAATNNFLYVLSTERADATQHSIKKLNRSNGTVAATFRLDDITPKNIGVVNDNLIYVLCGDATAKLYYIENFTNLVYVGNTVGQGFTPLGNVNGMFVGGAFYYGGNGIGFSANIFKITVACPSGSPPTAIVASANRGSASVAAGGTINASWANVLQPTVLDRIQLRPAPAAGHLGFVGAALASQLTGGAGTGSIVFTIPGGTPPGTYVFMYAVTNNIYVATSPTFTVT